MMMNRVWRLVILPPTKLTGRLGIAVELWKGRCDSGKTRWKIVWKYLLPDVAQVMGLTMDGKVIAVGESRVGIGHYTHLVGETVKKGETPEAAASRGLLEETGYRAHRIELLCTVLENTGRSDTCIHLFLATDCVKVREGEPGIATALLEPDEFWELLLWYFKHNPQAKHAGGNSLKLVTLAFDRLHILAPKGKPTIIHS